MSTEAESPSEVVDELLDPSPDQEQTEYPETEENLGVEEEPAQQPKLDKKHVDRSHFVHGLLVGTGMGCVATFFIVWVTLFFTPQIPMSATYESLLAIFIYPLIYVLSIGLIAVTAGVAIEFYGRK